MYGFPPVRPHLEHLWGLVVRALPSLPATLEWDVDLHAQWRDPSLALSQTCGWPVVTDPFTRFATLENGSTTRFEFLPTPAKEAQRYFVHTKKCPSKLTQ
jgi:hypothetical protein